MDYQTLLSLIQTSAGKIAPPEVRSEIYSFVQFYYVLIPLGIIGLWRWGMWLFKKLVGGLFYRPKNRTGYKEKISVVTPVYNEDPIIFAKALKSWCHNRVDEIIAVIDYTDKRSIKIFDQFSCRFPHVKTKLLITTIVGKREALADGIKASKSNIVALVDSDTIWDRNIKENLLAPFADPKVGGVAMRQDVYHPDTFVKKLFKIHLDLRFLVEMPYLAVMGDALMVLSGRTAVYRRIAIIGHLKELVNETFLGQKVISGDDKKLTQLIQANGWKTRYLKDIKVYTPGADNLKTYLKQRLRWARNTIRSDLKTLFSRWVWKREKPLAIYMVDRFIPPFTLLLGPAFIVTSLYYERYALVGIFLAWLVVSRFVKLLPHLREKPQDVLIIPIYIVLSYFEAVGKIYAFLTIDEQGWITRWSKSRLKKSVIRTLRLVPRLALALMIPFTLTFAVLHFETQRVEAVQRKTAEREAKLAEKRRIAEEKGPALAIKKAVMVNKEFRSQYDPEMEELKDALLQEAQDDPYGYYVVKNRDTLPKLTQLFNLANPSAILDGNKKPLRSSFLAPGQKLAISITDLRNTRNANTPLRVIPNPLIVTYSSLTNTIKVRGEGNAVNLRQISQLVSRLNRNVLQEVAPGEWILRSNLDISKKVTLILRGEEVKSLKLKSEPGKLVWIKAEDGSILITGTNISSWSEESNAPDSDADDGRSYITAKGSGRMDVLNSEISYLGYAGAPNRGGPFGGSYGLSWKIDSHKFRDNLITGVVEGNKIHHNYFGLYSFGATGIVIRNNDIYQNDQYGIDPHDDSNNLLIEDNKVHDNGNHGIIASKRCFDNIIQNNLSYGNKLHGIMLDQQSNNNIVRYNDIDRNVDGIAIYDSYNNVVINNKISASSKSGVRINDNSSRNFVGYNDMLNGTRGVYLYKEAKENLIFDNNISGNQFGVTHKTLQRNEFRNNLATGENKTDIYVLVGAENYEIR